MEKIVVKNSNERIDKFLALKLDISRSLIIKMIEADYILVNDKNVKASYKVKENDCITVKDNFVEETDIIPVKMDLNIVYEDNDILVINKPSGLVVHPGSGNLNNTLVNGLLEYTNSLSDVNGELRPGIVHRIDKDTSGLLLVAKNNKAHEILAKDIQDRKVRREYIALLDGVFPHNSASVDAPIGRDANDRKKMSVTANNSKKAITHLKVIKRYEKHTLVSCILETGRTHQIRVHMKYIGYPVHNDAVYSNKSEGNFGQFLHSAKIEFVHPITKEEMSFESDLPDYFKDVLEKLKSE